MEKTIIYVSLALGLISLVASILVSIKKTKIEGYAFYVSETKTILIMSALCFLLGGYFCYLKLFVEETMGGEGIQGYFLVGVLALIVFLLGSYTVAYCFCNRIYVFEEYMVVVKAFSGPFKVYWDDIEKVERPGMQKAARFTCKDVSFKVSGYNKKYKEFMTWIRLRLKGRTGRRLLNNVERNLSL